jgi:DNA-binding response OmpR family regulator
MRLLLIEDDISLNQTLPVTLKMAGYAVDVATDGEQGYSLAETNPYSLIILDYNLPQLSGREVIKKMRANLINTPVLIITVRSEVDDKVDLLTLGADDYLSKPFVSSELLARITAILRRPAAWQERILKIGELAMDLDKFVVTKNGRRVNLSSKEFSLLEYLLMNKGRILSRQTIMEHVWDENADPFSNTIEVHIRNLRKKLASAKHQLIFTFPNRGYKLDDER